uniref:DinB family protein n=1 Tax=Nocardia abscessus TaxID=120957 RepID=UPI002453F757
PVGAAEPAFVGASLQPHRSTFLLTGGGVGVMQLRRGPFAPSTMSLLGLVRHMTEVERGWFRRAAAGEDLAYVYCSENNPNGDFDDIADADPEATFAAFRAEIAQADRAVATLSLDHTFRHRRRTDDYNLRWVYLHMIEEYARHNGHADLLRERIDGFTGA